MPKKHTDQRQHLSFEFYAPTAQEFPSQETLERPKCSAMHVIPIVLNSGCMLQRAAGKLIRLVLAAWLTMVAAMVGVSRSDQAPGYERGRTTSVDFDRDVQPILAQHCLKCHGPERHEAELNLASRQSALDSGAIVPGAPDESAIIARVSADDEAERMPRDAPPLGTGQIHVLRRWIAAGAEWPGHWAYRPLKKPVVPVVHSSQLAGWCRTPVDRFIAARLEGARLAPSNSADRKTLLRRLYFDLLGLPPTPDEVAAFLADESPDAWQKQVDRLLASPRYGERWARHWMDLVHFAETHGHDQDRPRDHAWPYRDWLIHSLNRDKPYARFVAEQVAGDVLFPEEPSAIVATGFLAAGPWDESSLRDIREDSLDREVGRYMDRDDIVTTVMSTFTSTSVHCARCHDHKFDPITQDEYYGLQAVFAGIDKANRAYDPDPAVARRRSQLVAQRQRVAQQLAETSPELLTADRLEDLRNWEDRVKQRLALFRPLELTEYRSAAGAQLKPLEDGSLRAEGLRPDKDVYTLTARADLAHVTALRLDVLSDDALPKGGPGRQDNGNLHLNEIRVFALVDRAADAWRRLDLVNPRADFDQEGWPVAAALDGDPNSAWGIYPQVGKSHWAVFELAQPLEQPLALRVEMDQVHGGGHLIGRLRISATDRPLPLPQDAEDLPHEVTRILAIDPDRRSAEQTMQLAAWYSQRRIDQQLDALPAQSLVYCGTHQFQPDGSFRPAPVLRTVHVLRRGLVTEPMREAVPGTLSCLEGLDHDLPASSQDEGARRAALARWLTDPKNVLTWRSVANRVWQYHFGQGLVDTPNDFGHMGTAPTHPELLDWLAATLQENGGSLKHLHRLIVTSAVYQQSSQIRSDSAAVDADNRLLWRMNRRRLDAESFHDALLVISGSLDGRMGGPSVKQFIQTPGVHVTPNVDYLNFDVNDAANYRRSVYRFLFRTIPDPLMDALDCPDASQWTPHRTTSLTPLQALATLNDKFVVKQSELLAERIARCHSTPKGQVEHAFELLDYRCPTERERSAVSEYVSQHGLANACRYLINTNEFLFVD